MKAHRHVSLNQSLKVINHKFNGALLPQHGVFNPHTISLFNDTSDHKLWKSFKPCFGPFPVLASIFNILLGLVKNGSFLKLK